MTKRNALSREESDQDFSNLKLQIEYLPIASLVEPAVVLRSTSKAQDRRIARSVRDHGFVVPITASASNVITTGGARVRAAKLLGLKEVPVVRLEHLTEDQARLFAMADNHLAEGREWNTAALRMEFASISISSPKLDLGRSGFSIAKRDIIIGRHRAAEMDDLGEAALAEAEAEALAAESAVPVSRAGDIFEWDGIRLACGDATDPDVIAAALDGWAVRTVVSDLPYNVQIEGNVSGQGKIVHSEFAMASGEMTTIEFTSFLGSSIGASELHLIDGALHYYFMDWRHMTELLEAARRQSLTQLNLLVWAKDGGLGSFYRSAHELIGVFKSGTAQHINNINLGRDGRNRTNVLHYPGANTFTPGRAKALALHPTVKPVALIADLILDSSDVGDVVLDMFGGSGTTAVAAHRTDRKACLVEISPKFVDAAVRRIDAAVGKPGRLIGTGKTLDELARERGEAVGASHAA